MAGGNWSIWDILGFAYGVYRDQNPKDPKQTPIEMTPEQRALFDKYMGALNTYTNTTAGTSDYITNVINQAGSNWGNPTFKSDYMKDQSVPTPAFAGQTLFPGMGNGQRPWGSPTPTQTKPPMGGRGGGGGGRPMRMNLDMDSGGGAGWDGIGGGGGWSEDYYNNPYNVSGSQYSFGPGNGTGDPGIIDNWGTSRGTPGTPGYAPGYRPGQNDGSGFIPGSISGSASGGSLTGGSLNDPMTAPGGTVGGATLTGGVDWESILNGTALSDQTWGQGPVDALSVFGSNPGTFERLFSQPPEAVLGAAVNDQSGGGMRVVSRIGEAFREWKKRNPDMAKRLGLDDPTSLLVGAGSLAGINPVLVLGFMGGWKLWQAARKGYFGQQPGRG